MTSGRSIDSPRVRIRIRDCRKCKNLVKSRSRIVIGHGPISAGIMFVGLAPGRNGADLTGIPFTKDPSGILFQEALIKAGFSLESKPDVKRPRLRNVYVTNLVKCNPKDRRGNNRAPTEREIGQCIGYLWAEMMTVKPKVIVTLGRTVTKHMLGTIPRDFAKMCGKPIQIGDIRYIPIVHPSYVVRGAYDRNEYFDKFRKIRLFLKEIS